MNYVICCDFDGTITLKDTGKELLNTLTDKDWQYYDKLVIEGEIGTRAALVRQWGMIDYTTMEDIDSIVGKIEIDPSFRDFYNWIKSENLQFLIISDGFRTYIKKILQNHQINIPNHQIRANDMKLKDNKIALEFLTEQCVHGCANCKYSHVNNLRKENSKIIYIGDGLSDIFPARELADIIFARENEDLAIKLANDERLRVFSDFNQIRDEMLDIMH